MHVLCILYAYYELEYICILLHFVVCILEEYP